MPRSTPVQDVMTTDVLSFHADDNVGDAMALLVDRSIDGAPVIDGDATVIGMLSTADLIVQETELHVPTIISLFGATLELPSAHKHFEDDLRKTLGSTVSDVMQGDPVTVGPTDTIETAATLLHDHEVSRLPVVDDRGHLVGIISRVDVLREIIRDEEPPADA